MLYMGVELNDDKSKNYSLCCDSRIITGTIMWVIFHQLDMSGSNTQQSLQ